MFIKVSIIIPAYNVEKYIQRSIKSVISQTLKEIEVIVVNDGSTDNTKLMLEELAMLDTRLMVLNKKNGGPSSARNRGLEIAKGEYLLYLDGDDWIEPTACEELYKLAKNSDLDIVVADLYTDDDSGTIVKRKQFENQMVQSGIDFLKYTFNKYESLYVCNKLIRKSLHDGIRFPLDLSYGEDLLTMGRLAIGAKKVASYNGAFLHYIYNPRSTTNSDASKKFYQAITAMKRLKLELINKGYFNDLAIEFDGYSLKHAEAFLYTDMFPEDKDYNKGVTMALAFMKTKPNIPKDYPFISKIELTILKFGPNTLTLKYINKGNKLKKFIKKILQ